MAYSKCMFSNMISDLYFVVKNQISYSDDIIYLNIRFYMHVIFYMFHVSLIWTMYTPDKVIDRILLIKYDILLDYTKRSVF